MCLHRLPLANNGYDPAYRRNRLRSIAFLVGLGVLLIAAFLLSLGAGSYNTPVTDLVRGIFGRAADDKINLVVRNNRLPRICTAIIAGGGGWGSPAVCSRRSSAIPWPPPPPWGFPRGPASGRPLPSLC